MKRLVEWQRWTIFGILTVAVIVFVAYEEQDATKQYEREHQELCTQASVTLEQKKQCAYEADTTEKHMHWWYILGAWPGGIEAWAIVATGFAIAWQSNETRRSAKAALISAIRGEEAHKVARNKDKPRIFVKVVETNFLQPQPYVTYNIEFECPTPAYSVSVRAGVQTRMFDMPSAPDIVLTETIPATIRSFWENNFRATIVGEGGIPRMSSASIERLHAGEIILVLSVRVLFEDVYGKRDFMKSFVYKGTGLNNPDGTPFSYWDNGPKNLDWDVYVKQE